MTNRRQWLLGAMSGATLLAGCSLGTVRPAPTRLDLGASANPAPTALRFKVLALPPFNEARLVGRDDVIWRLGPEGMPNRYATYRWREPPSALVRERLFERLSVHGPVLTESISAEVPQLQVTLMQFEQVFTPDGSSNQAVVTLQAVLLKNGEVAASFLGTESEPGASNDAPGGAQALRVATDRLIARLVQWLLGTMNGSMTS